MANNLHVTPATATNSRNNLLFAGCFLLLLISWLLTFADTLWSMQAIWRRSDTFAHGFLIIPISLYLIWQKRTETAALDWRPCWYALPLLLLLLLLWLFADVTAVDAAKQLAVILMIPVLVWLCLGTAVFKLWQFPLAYLIFAVPLGDSLVPQLQQVTADISVAALRWSQIPVYREGLYLTIPSGVFHVAEACSGIRYLIASLATGTIFAYLSYRSKKKQLIFVLASVVVPVIANGLRAYGIIMIAHVSGMKYAVGVDHLIYGWAFFGLIVFLMFYVGNKFADPVATTASSSAVSVTGARQQPWLALLVAILLPGTLLLNNVSSQQTTAPYNITQLQQSLTPVTDPTLLPQFSHASDLVQGQIQHIAFYAAFYRHQHNKELVNWDNKIFQSELWAPSTQQRLSLTSVGAFSVTEVDLRALPDRKMLMWYWYQTADTQTANPTLATFYQALSKVFGISAYGSFFALSIEYEGDVQQARAQLEQQLNQMLPLLRQLETGPQQ
ncbi:exosortase A [Rheinheimera sp.]|uniref:exosortase A n=1 Tax=Rheinheimera sp. TaxID=1869214 RepID=UPI0027B88368|nr:exosortase A [Rheinheimera sp.]